jgi:hypothetical protein
MPEDSIATDLANEDKEDEKDESGLKRSAQVPAPDFDRAKNSEPPWTAELRTNAKEFVPKPKAKAALPTEEASMKVKEIPGVVRTLNEPVGKGVAVPPGLPQRQVRPEYARPNEFGTKSTK